MTIPVSPSSLTFARPTRRNAPLRLALVNNMPDQALRTTERQFRNLIARAVQGNVAEGQAGAGNAVEIEIYHIPQTPRGEAGLDYCQENSRPLAALLATQVDACIVTGCEPKASSLRDEPFWTAFTDLVDWARDNTRSTLFSCLAAHAAVLHLDRIERRRLPAKLSGLYVCRNVGTHPLVAETGSVVVPHSRYNALSEEDLVAKGYEILTRSQAAGVDAFIKPGPSLLVFLQGHPEYEVDTLAREFRRDVERYLAGTTLVPPAAPENYFTRLLPPGSDRLDTMADDARRRALADLAAQLDPLRLQGAAWQDDAAAFYRRWLGLVRQEVSRDGAVPVPSGLSAHLDTLDHAAC